MTVGFSSFPRLREQRTMIAAALAAVLAVLLLVACNPAPGVTTPSGNAKPRPPAWLHGVWKCAAPVFTGDVYGSCEGFVVIADSIRRGTPNEHVDYWQVIAGRLATQEATGDTYTVTATVSGNEWTTSGDARPKA